MRFYYKTIGVRHFRHSFVETRLVHYFQFLMLGLILMECINGLRRTACRRICVRTIIEINAHCEKFSIHILPTRLDVEDSFLIRHVLVAKIDSGLHQNGFLCR